MATRKVTLSIDQTAWTFAKNAAARAGISPSAWISAAARREAVRLGAGTDWGNTEAAALAEDADLAVAEQRRPRPSPDGTSGRRNPGLNHPEIVG
jgi:hypothetical protein